MKRLATVLLGGCILVGLGAGASVASSSATSVKVGLREYAISATPASVKHGKVTFVVTNNGKDDHELIVVKTNKNAAKLLTRSGRADETGSRGEIAELAPGKTKRLTLNLPVGHYVLLCNMGSHYKLGMHRDLVVK